MKLKNHIDWITNKFDICLTKTQSLSKNSLCVCERLFDIQINNGIYQLSSPAVTIEGLISHCVLFLHRHPSTQAMETSSTKLKCFRPLTSRMTITTIMINLIQLTSYKNQRAWESLWRCQKPITDPRIFETDQFCAGSHQSL